MCASAAAVRRTRAAPHTQSEGPPMIRIATRYGRVGTPFLAPLPAVLELTVIKGTTDQCLEKFYIYVLATLAVEKQF